MKRLNLILAVAALGSSFQACLDLDTVNPSSLSSNSMWKTEALVKAGIDGIYNVFTPNSAVDGVTDFPYVHCIGRPRLELISCTSASVYVPSFINREHPSAWDAYFSTEWMYCYEAIHEANDAIANMHLAGMPAEKEERYMCEARLLRAYFYQRLNMLFQGVPVYLEPVTNAECIKPCSSADEVWKACIDDLDYCINSTQMPDNTLHSRYGRPSKGAAYAMRGQIHLWKKEYEEALSDFEHVDSCGYALYTGEYEDIFTEAGEKNCEQILPLQFSRTPGFGDWSQLWFGSRSTLNSHTRLHPSPFLVESFENKDGSEFKWEDYFPGWDSLDSLQREVFFVRDSMDTKTESAWSGAKDIVLQRVGQAVWDSYYLNIGNEERLHNAFKDRDPRLAQIIFVPAESYETCSGTGMKSSIKSVRWPYIIPGNGETDGDLWTVEQTSFYYCYKKFVVVNDATMQRECSGIDWPLIRYTDILLSKAEVLNELGRASEAIAFVNQVRDRAHMPHYPVGSREEVLKRIQHEKRIELCGEGVNFFDEVRWGTYKDSKFGGEVSHYQGDVWGKAIYHMYWKDYIWPWPIPAGAVQKNPNLTKTAGWEY